MDPNATNTSAIVQAQTIELLTLVSNVQAMLVTSDARFNRRSGSGYTAEISPPTPGGWGGTNGGGTNPSVFYPIVFTDSDLYFYTNITGLASNTSDAVIIHTPTGVTNRTYGVYFNTNLLFTTNWAWLFNTQPGQTNLTLTNLPTIQGFFRLGPPGGGYIPNGLVDYWRLYDGSGTTAFDSILKTDNLYLSNSPSWGSNCLILNGTNQYGNAGTNGEVTYGDMSVCAWINMNGFSGGPIIDKSIHSNMVVAGWGFWVNTNQNLEFWAQVAATDYGNLAVQPGEWQFVTAVLHFNSSNPGNSSVDFYINGILSGYTNNSSLENVQTIFGGNPYANLKLGGLGSNVDFPGGNQFFDGSIHDVGVYNRALSPGEIATNFFNTEFSTNIPYPGLLYYKMTEFNPANTNEFPFNLADSSTHGGTTGAYEGGYSHIWTFNPAGISNTAVHFDGVDSYIDTSNSVLFNFTTNSFTINLWVQPTSSYDHYLLQNCDGGTNNGWFIYYNATYQVSFGTVSDGTVHTISTGGSSQGANNGTWTMVTVVRSGPTSTLIYINGQVGASGNLPNPSSSTNSLKFGVGPGGTNHYDGDIWQTQIWSTPLSATNIENLYLRQTNGIPWP